VDLFVEQTLRDKSRILDEGRVHRTFRWHTADGRDLLVTEMDDEHIQNAIQHIRLRIYPEMPPFEMEQSAIALRHFMNEQKRRNAATKETAIVMFTKDEVRVLAEYATYPWNLETEKDLQAWNSAMKKLKQKAQRSR
jgi:hypothetical protein